MDDNMAETIQKIEAASRRFGVLSEDARQEMILHVLESRRKHPGRQDTPAFLAWRARLSVVRRFGLDGYNRQAGFERMTIPLVFSNNENDEVAIDLADPLAVRSLADVDLADLIRALPPRLAKLAALLAEGLTMAEAARELGISRQLANHRKNQLAALLRPLFF